MNKKIWTIIIVLIFIGLISVIIFNNSKTEKIDNSNKEREEAINELVKKPEITLITKHQYKDGVHTYIGEFETPTPCYSYNAEIKESGDQKVIELTYSPEENSETCIQVVDTKTFNISYEGPADDEVIATLNGEVVNLNIFEVPDDQDISTYEVMIKG